MAASETCLYLSQRPFFNETNDHWLASDVNLLCTDYNDIILDPNTANPFLYLSDDQRVVTTRLEPQPYPDHPHRFTSWAQVLCRAGMAGRCYWEVEWAGTGGVSIGVCYKNMSRSGGGSDSKLGHNSKSWSLDCSYSACSFQHNKENVTIAAPCCRRIGVYLDLRGGTLSFFNISDTMVLLHKVKTTFKLHSKTSRILWVCGTCRFYLGEPHM